MIPLLLATAVLAGGSQDVLINEVLLNPAGTDTVEFVEVSGPPDHDLSDFTVLNIEGDGAGAGLIDVVLPIGQTDANGLWLSAYLSNTLENGTSTYLLVKGFTGSVGQDLDTDNDGVFDITPWSSMVDSVAFTDGGLDIFYSPVLLTPNFDGFNANLAGASRIPNGQDTNQVSDWRRNDNTMIGMPQALPGTLYSFEVLNTPGAVNAEFCPGDFNADSQINLDDLQILLFNFGASVVPATNGDASINGVVNLDDLQILLFNFGIHC